jgi:hypothetical protein
MTDREFWEIKLRDSRFSVATEQAEADRRALIKEVERLTEALVIFERNRYCLPYPE